jgi:O-antigen ligase
MKLLMPGKQEDEDTEIKNVYTRRRPKFLLYYQSVLAVAAIFIFFTAFDIYFWEGFHIIPPVGFVNLYIAGTLILFAFAKISKVTYKIPKELLVWGAGYLAISSCSFILLLSFPSYVEELGFQQLRTRILSEVFLLMMFLIFSNHTKVQKITKLAICLAVVLSVFNNIVELTNPLAFGGINTSGRPAGFYLNPNGTGSALMLGLIFGIGALPKKIRVFYSFIVLIGVFLTVSRGAILGWFIVMGVLCKTNLVPRKQLLFWVVSIVGFSIIFGSILSGLFDLDELQRSGVITANVNNIHERLDWLQNPKSEDSADSRLEVVAIAWKMFGEHPWLGNGLGSTDNINGLGISTHNMYLQLMTDHGIIGVTILPALVYAVTRNVQGESRSIAWAFGVFIMLWGFFSHNILEDRVILIGFSLMAAMSKTSQYKPRHRGLPQLPQGS